MSDEPDIRAAEAALGLVEDAAAGVAADTWRDHLAPLALAVPPLAPRRDLWPAIAARLDTAAIESGTVTVRSDALDWEDVGNGCRIKTLYGSRASGRLAVLLELAPGGRFPGHGHPEGVEECYVLRGEVKMGEVVARAGDFHVALTGSRHQPLESATGALLFITKPLAA